MAKSNGKKRRFKLKNSARKTIASLALVSSIIVAAIPVSNVSAQGDEFPAEGSSIPSLDTVLEKYAFCNEDLDVTPSRVTSRASGFSLQGVTSLFNRNSNDNVSAEDIQYDDTVNTQNDEPLDITNDISNNNSLEENKEESVVTDIGSLSNDNTNLDETLYSETQLTNDTDSNLSNESTFDNYNQSVSNGNTSSNENTYVDDNTIADLTELAETNIEADSSLAAVNDASNTNEATNVDATFESVDATPKSDTADTSSNTLETPSVPENEDNEAAILTGNPDTAEASDTSDTADISETVDLSDNLLETDDAEELSNIDTEQDTPNEILSPVADDSLQPAIVTYSVSNDGSPANVNPGFAYPLELNSDGGVAVRTIMDANAVQHDYYVIDVNGSGMTLNNGGLVPLYEMGKVDNDYDCIKKYLGTQNHYNLDNGIVNLGNYIGYTRADYSVYDDPYLAFEGYTPYKYIEVLRIKRDFLQNITCYIEIRKIRLKFDIYEGETEAEREQRKYEFINKFNNDPDDVTAIESTVFYAAGSIMDVTYIGDESFKGESNIAQITFPEGITKVGKSAFENCFGLTTVNLYTRLKSIGVKAFNNCENLNSINIESLNTLETIGDGAFANCGFSSIQLPASLSKLGSGAFYGCRNLDDSLEKSESMFRNYINHELKIGEFVFANCTSLKNIKLYENIYEIGNKSGPVSGTGTFAGCTSLQHVWMPENFGSRGGQKQFANGTFYKAGKNGSENVLEWVRVGDNADKGHNSSFEDLKMFVNGTNKTDADTDLTVSEGFAIWGPPPNSSTDPYNYAKKYSNTYMWEYPNGVMNYELTLNGYKFRFNTEGAITKCEIDTENLPEDVDLSPTLEIPKNIGGTEITAIKEAALKGLASVNNKEGVACPKTVKIYDNIKFVENNAFYNCGSQSLEEVDIETKGVELGTASFSSNPKLKQVKFQQNTKGGDTTIGNECFYNCPSLQVVEFRNDDFASDENFDVNVTSIGTDAFKTLNKTPFNYEQYDKKVADNCWLVFKGTFDVDGVPYNPYLFACNGSSKVSTFDNTYITYVSGNPENIVTRYDNSINNGQGGVSILSYPTVDTIVGTNEDGQNVSVHDLMKKQDNGEPLYSNQRDIIDNAYNIKVPYLVTNIDNVGNDIGGEHHKYFNSINDPYNCGHGVKSIYFVSLDTLPDYEDVDTVEQLENFIGCFSDNESLSKITFGADMKSLGEFVFDKKAGSIGSLSFHNAPALSTIEFVGDQNTYNDASPENPYYWAENGIVYSYDGTNTYIEEVLNLRGTAGSDISSSKINAENDPSLEKVTAIKVGAFNNCKEVSFVNLESSKGLKTIPECCFEGCNSLAAVTLPDSLRSIRDYAFMDSTKNSSGDYDLNNKTPSVIDGIVVTIPGQSVDISDSAFDYDKNPTIIGIPDSATEEYVNRMKGDLTTHYINDFTFESYEYYTVTFYNYDGTLAGEVKNVPAGTDVPTAKVPTPKDKGDGWVFTGWVWNGQVPGYFNVTENRNVFAQFDKQDTPTPTPSTTPTPTAKPTSTPKPTGSGSSSSSSKSTSSSSSSSPSSSSSTQSSSTINSSTIPIVIGGYNNNITPSTATNSGNSSNTGNAVNNTTRGNGQTTVISTTNGMTDVGKMSATVNGSSDNYVVKITETQEANECAVKALSAEYGSLDNIRYLPIDISLYDSTGTNKISPVPEGVTVSLTVPIPDDLAIYGGNAKAASTQGGVLEKMAPKFTMINSVPCMTFTASHFSPYVIYVDTANLSDPSVMDSTPKTGDMIHPKWFLAIGLAAAGIFLFLKKDKEDKAARATA